MAGNTISSKLTIAKVLLRSPRLGEQEWNKLSWFLRWLVMIRSVVLLPTIMASGIGILSARLDGNFELDRAIALLTGLTFVHATNNLLNDWVGHRKGIDEVTISGGVTVFMSSKMTWFHVRSFLS